MVHVSSIILCLDERFGELAVDGENVEIDTRVADGDKILHNICIVLDIRNSSVIRQKGESQNGCFKKTKHANFSEKRIFFTP